MSYRFRVRRLGRTLLGVATLTAVAGLMVGATTSVAAPAKGIYIVQMLQNPAVAYSGDIAGLAATKPAKGEKINPRSAAVTKYADYLKGQHDAALAKVGGAEKIYDYVYTYNGFAARLSENQAALLRTMKGVLGVTENEMVSVDTSSTPTFLGLDAPGGLWAQLGGANNGKDGGAGEGVVIGIVDSGIWPENKSFTDRDSNGKLIFQQIPGWHGKCTPGESFNASMCNQKLVGGQHFNASWGGDAGVEAERPWEYQSVRDYNGHGTHTAGTSGGNHAVPATGQASLFGSVSGMAPRARIAAYKALWSTQDGSTASGFTADLAAAIDQAVADGVDVINYSVSGATTNFLDPVQVAFLFAADAGVFVSASAGNSGPATGTVAHPSPWLTTVAAGTHNRSGNGSVTLGNAATYSGASLTPGVGPAPLINATAAGLPGADPNLLRQCFLSPAVLDPALVAGKIVVCERGGAAPLNARVDKSAAVQAAGGVGVIIWNVTASSLNADLHTIPAVHVDHVAGPAIATYAGTPGATATIATATVVLTAPAPFTAAFSSRGPSPAAASDLLKPDVIAPGQDILAAVSPATDGRDFDLLSGTSMSAPHVAGLAALLKDKHPSWSPMAIKSALMTSAGDILDGPNTNPLVIHRQGAGHVRPNNAADPGLVFDHGFLDWLKFLQGQNCNCLGNPSFPKIDASDLNLASIAIGDLPGIQTVTRTVTNVGSTSSTYTSAVTGLAGITVAVSPSSFSIAPGATQSFTVSFTRTTATLGSFHGGQLTWTDGTHSVRMPMVIRPVGLGTPAQVTSTGAPVSWDVKTGYTGALTASVAGLVPATQTPYTVAQDPDQTFNPADATGTFSTTVAVPANSLFRTGIYEDAITPAGTDLDLFVFNGATFVGQSADGDSNEEVTIRTGATGATFTVYVHGWSTNGPSASGTLFNWVATSDAGNTTISGVSSAVTGATQTHTATFTGLAPGTRYLGEVRYSDGAATIGRTILSVRTP